MTCVFCDIIAGAEPLDPELTVPGKYAVFEPLEPHVPGHLLVIPWPHVTDMTDSLVWSMMTARHAAKIIRDKGIEANMLTSAGPSATQSVFHLHWHILPRGPEDGLLPGWPWRCGTIHDLHVPGKAVNAEDHPAAGLPASYFL